VHGKTPEKDPARIVMAFCTWSCTKSGATIGKEFQPVLCDERVIAGDVLKRSEPIDHVLCVGRSSGKPRYALR
jgi:hypothetical protein